MIISRDWTENGPMLDRCWTENGPMKTRKIEK